MRKLWRPLALILAVTAGLGIATYAVGSSGQRELKADRLTGYQENPDISTTGTGRFEIRIDDRNEEFTYKLSYSGLEGAVTQAHVHFGKRAVNGGVSFFLCGTPASPGPAGTPTCPQSGTVERTVTAAEILGPTTQGIEAMNFDEIAQAMRAGHTYANVHTTKWPTGEIRAQINDHDDDD